MDGYPRVVIVVEGGLVQTVASDIHLEVALVDHDVEVIDDEDSIIGEYALDSVGPDAVNDLLQEAKEEDEKRHKERG